MKLSKLAFSVVLATGVIGSAQGCSVFDNDATASQEQICTPDANVFCKCANLARGTKRCADDGRSFEACRLPTGGACVGGEIPDENTNQPVDSNGKVINPIQPKNVIESCPGRSTAAQPGVEVVIEGETTVATQDREGRQGACAVGGGANDHVYRIIPSGSGSLDVKVQGEGGLNPVAYIRTTCDDKESQVACAPPGPAELAQMRTQVQTGKDYFLVIDGASTTTGKYTAKIKLATQAFCGDGKVDKDEACDDGNKASDTDGCSNNCQKVTGNPPSGGTCPGQAVDVWPGRTVTGVGTTTSYGNAWSSPDRTCFSAGTNDYQDHIYAVTPHETGTLTVSLTAPPTGTLANLMISARRSCSDAATTTTQMCTNVSGSGGTGEETLTLPVTIGETVFIGIDGGGITANKSDYTIAFKTAPPVR